MSQERFLVTEYKKVFQSDGDMSKGQKPVLQSFNQRKGLEIFRNWKET